MAMRPHVDAGLLVRNGNVVRPEPRELIDPSRDESEVRCVAASNHNRHHPILRLGEKTIPAQRKFDLSDKASKHRCVVPKVVPKCDHKDCGTS
jgi:hypothetical protein